MPDTTSSTIANTMAAHETPMATNSTRNTSDAGNTSIVPRHRDLSSPNGLDLNSIPIASNLMDLPNELLIPIINNTYADDLESFARVNKRIFNLSQDALKEHWKLHRDHSEITIEWYSYDVGKLAHLVVKNFKNPFLAQYVRVLKAEYLESSKTACPDYPSDALVDIWRSLCATLKHSITTYAIRSIRRGNDGPVLAFLLICLPNLRFLKLNLLLLDSVWLLIQVINHIIAGNGPNTLSKLRTLIVADYQHSSNLELFKCLLHIHSLRFVRFTGMNDGLGHCRQMNPAPKSSDITTLHLTNCNIGDRTLESILNCMNQLQTFSIEFLSHSKKTELEPSRIPHILEMRCNQTLVSLKVLGCHICGPAEDDKHYYIGPLKAFAILKELEINIELIFSEHVSHDMDFAAELPPSIETLLLHTDSNNRRFFRSSEVARRFLRSISTLDRLPRLQTIGFRHLDAGSVDWLQETGLEAFMHHRGGTVKWEKGFD